MTSEGEQHFTCSCWMKRDAQGNITHVKIDDPSVKVIPKSAFSCWWGKYGNQDYSRLMNVELCDGLEIIGEHAFDHCKSLVQIIIPSSVKVIGIFAFLGCSQLMNVELSEGLERIGMGAFSSCTSLECISIPSTIKVISYAFSRCKRLMNVELREGLERIPMAFEECTSLSTSEYRPPSK